MPAFVQSKCVLSPKGALVNDLPIQGGALVPIRMPF